MKPPVIKECPSDFDIENLLKEPLIDRIFLKLPYGYRLRDWYYNCKLFFVSKYQILRYGVSDKECWCLTTTFSAYILPRLIHFKKMNRFSHPCDLNEEKWNEIIDELIWTFDYIQNPEKYNPIPEIDWSDKLESDSVLSLSGDERPKFDVYLERSKELDERKRKGLLLFAERFDNLWD